MVRPLGPSIGLLWQLDIKPKCKCKTKRPFKRNQCKKCLGNLWWTWVLSVPSYHICLLFKQFKNKKHVALRYYVIKIKYKCKKKKNQTKIKKKKFCVQTTKHDLKAVLWYKLVLWLKNPIVYFSTSSLIDFVGLITYIYNTKTIRSTIYIWKNTRKKNIFDKTPKT